MANADEGARTARELALAARRRKGEDIVLLDLRGLSNFTDFFVLVSGNNTRHNKAVAEELEAQAKTLGLAKLGSEMSDDMSWILLDFCDVVIHVFLAETRTYYGLEFLWEDAPRIDLGVEEEVES